jgi:23S rRNA pseudouridine2604 synthase
MKTPLGKRINQRLAHEGYATRRGADELIEDGLVFVNGRKAKIGDRVLDTDIIEVKGVRSKAYSYVAFNKPVGMDIHDEDAALAGTKGISASLPPEFRKLGLFPVGRLDKESRGLVILSNDGRITDRLLNPDRAHEKAYEVTTLKPLRESFKQAMETGVNIEGYETKPALVDILWGKEIPRDAYRRKEAPNPPHGCRVV